MLFSFLLVSFAWAATEQVTLQDLQKHDYSIRLAVPNPKPAERCFLLPNVNQALTQVQQKAQLLQARLRVLQCYSPADPVFAKGSTVKLELAEKGTLAEKDFQKLLKREGFRAVDREKGIYVHGKSDSGEARTTPVDQLP